MLSNRHCLASPTPPYRLGGEQVLPRGRVRLREVQRALQFGKALIERHALGVGRRPLGRLRFVCGFRDLGGGNLRVQRRGAFARGGQFATQALVLGLALRGRLAAVRRVGRLARGRGLGLGLQVDRALHALCGALKTRLRVAQLLRGGGQRGRVVGALGLPRGRVGLVLRQAEAEAQRQIQSGKEPKKETPQLTTRAVVKD